MFKYDVINIKWNESYRGTKGIMTLNLMNFFPCSQANMNKLLKVLDLELRSNDYYSSNEMVIMRFLLMRYHQFIKFEDQKTADKYKRNIRQLQAFMNKNYIMNIDLEKGINLLLEHETDAEYIEFMHNEYADLAYFYEEVLS